jgi:hypothetical protein
MDVDTRPSLRRGEAVGVRHAGLQSVNDYGGKVRLGSEMAVQPNSDELYNDPQRHNHRQR